MTTSIHLAVKRGALSEVQSLLEANPDLIDARNDEGETILYPAVEGGHLEIVEDLLLREKKLLRPHGNHNLPIHRLKFTLEEQRLPMFQLLLRFDSRLCQRLDDKRKPFYRYLCSSKKLVSLLEFALNRIHEDMFGSSTFFAMMHPMHYAAKKGNMTGLELILTAVQKHFTDEQSTYGMSNELTQQFLLQFLNAKGSRGETAVFKAARKGHVEIIDRLIQIGCTTLDTPNLRKKTPLYIAASHGHAETVKVIYRHANGATLSNSKKRILTHRSFTGFLPIHVAACKGHLQVVKEMLMMEPDLIREMDGENRTLFHIAARGGHIDILELLFSLESLYSLEPLKTGLSKQKDENGYLPISEAIRINATTPEQKLNQKKIIYFLLQRGGSVRSGENEQTPLSVCASVGHPDIFYYLLELGAISDVDLVDKMGRTPLWNAVYQWNMNPLPMVEAILRASTHSIDIPDIDSGRTPIAAAIRAIRIVSASKVVYEPVVMLLQAIGANISSAQAMTALTIPMTEDFVIDARFRIYFSLSLTQRLLWTLAAAESHQN